MHVFIYEYVTGGGWFEQPNPPSESLLQEAAAMARAIAADFAKLAGVHVWLTRDSRLPPLAPPGCGITLIDSSADDSARFRELAARADWTLLIAPETGGILLERARQVVASAGRLLSPPPAFIELASDKQQTAARLAAASVPVAPGLLLDRRNTPLAIPFSFPLVAKPNDGCGSQDVRLVTTPAELNSLPKDGSLRIERFIPGMPVSVAVLSGPAGDFPLAACSQRLTSDGHFTYLGGRLPLARGLNQRAQTLALLAARAIGPRTGYWGLDLIVGAADDGSQDSVIEINPRLTTSYVGLRAAARKNLAAAMLAVAAGRPPDLEFSHEPLEFTAAGHVLPLRPALTSRQPT